MTAPWETEDDAKLSDIIKKAKRVSTLRTVVISLIISVIVLVGGEVINTQLTSRSADRALMDEHILKWISGPNQYISGYTNESGFLSGRMEFSKYKIVEGVPIPWSTKKTVYKVLPFLSLINLSGSSEQDQLLSYDPVMLQQGYTYSRQYNGLSGQRELAFYIPDVNYNGMILNDLTIVQQMNPEKLVEMALSFDRPYSLTDARNMIPADLTQAWYWVDTYDDKAYLEPHRGADGTLSYANPTSLVYGFGKHTVDNSSNAVPQIEESQFIESLAWCIKGGAYVYECERIYNYLRGEKEKPDAADIRILGVVVTGSAKEFSLLKEQPYVRGAVLGAVVDRY